MRMSSFHKIELYYFVAILYTIYDKRRALIQDLIKKLDSIWVYMTWEGSLKNLSPILCSTILANYLQKMLLKLVGLIGSLTYIFRDQFLIL